MRIWIIDNRGKPQSSYTQRVKVPLFDFSVMPAQSPPANSRYSLGYSRLDRQRPVWHPETICHREVHYRVLPSEGLFLNPNGK